MNLQDYIAYHFHSGMSIKEELELVINYIVEIKAEGIAIPMLSEIASKAFYRYEKQADLAYNWAFVDYYPPLMKQYKDEEITHYLCTALKQWFAKDDISDQSLEWLKNNAMNIEPPIFFYQPFAEWLKKEKNIHFKEIENVKD